MDPHRKDCHGTRCSLAGTVIKTLLLEIASMLWRSWPRESMSLIVRVVAEVRDQIVVGAAFVGEHRHARAELNQGPVDGRISRSAASKSGMPIVHGPVEAPRTSQRRVDVPPLDWSAAEQEVRDWLGREGRRRPLKSAG